MILRELFYFDKKSMEPIEDNRYDSEDDTSVVDLDDTRKTRLSLRDINKARRAEEAHRQEATRDLEYVRSMYGLQAQGTEEAM